jgi:hypothetical protein
METADGKLRVLRAYLLVYFIENIKTDLGGSVSLLLAGDYTPREGLRPDFVSGSRHPKMKQWFVEEIVRR